MKFSEFVTRSEYVCLKDVIPLLQQIYVNSHNWNVDDTVEMVFENKRRYVLNIVLIKNIKNKIIDGELVYDYIFDDEGNPCAYEPEIDDFVKELKHGSSQIDIKSLIKYVANDIKDLDFIPDDLLAIAGIENPNKKTPHIHSKSDPDVNKELGTLRNEKLKWDASIRSATEIGLLFIKGELPKPTTKDAFVKEFNSKVGGLPDSTVEMIYKALPSEYRHKGGKPKMAISETTAAVTGTADLNIAIKAAVYAGSMYETREAKDVSRLSAILKENDYTVPSEAILNKIVEYVKDV